MTIDRSAGAEVVDLDKVRMARRAKKADARDHEKLAKHMGFTRELADSITLEKGLEIAQGIVEKFGSESVLLRAYLKRRKQESSSKVVDLHEVLKRQREVMLEFSPDDFKALMALYDKNPSEYYETYVLPAAEEFLRRFPSEQVQEA